jgi:hypothetical protein
MDLAREFGLEISFDNPRPGVIIKTLGEVDHCNFYDLFPELQPGCTHYVKVEECRATFTSDFDLTQKDIAWVQDNNDFTDPDLLNLAA